MEEEGSSANAQFVTHGIGKRGMAIIVAVLMLISSVPFFLSEQKSDESLQPWVPSVAESPEQPQKAGALSTSMRSTVLTPSDIALYWAPVWYQNTWDDEMDFITKINYDGDWNTHDNYEEIDEYNLPAYIYYSFLETDTHFFIGYWDYHPMDYYAYSADVGGGRIYSDASEHENDMEGVLLIVAKNHYSDYGDLVCMETIAHYSFYQYGVIGVNYVLPKGAAFEVPEPFVYFEDGHHPKVYVEPGGHGVFGHPIDRHSYSYEWFGDFPDASPGTVGTCKYVPGTTAGVPAKQTASQTCQYALIAVDDSAEGFWQYRGQFPTFYDFAKFRGEEGGDNKANAPWGQNCHYDNDPITGDIFFDPAQLFLMHFNYLGPFDRSYIWNPFAIELTVSWYYVAWARDGGGDLSDAYLTIRMYDGAGDPHKVLDGQQFLFEGLDPPLDPRVNTRGGTDKSWIWWEAERWTTTYPEDLTFYGMAYPGKSDFSIMSRDWDCDWEFVSHVPVCVPNEDEVLMGYWSAEEGYVEEDYFHYYNLVEGMNEFNWIGSAVGIIGRGDGVEDDDTIAPRFASSKCWPSTHLFASDARSILFQSTITENVGLSKVELRVKSSDLGSQWSGWMEAACSAVRSRSTGGYDFDYTCSVTREKWLQYEGHRLQYQWRAIDNDNDRPGDSLNTTSTKHWGPEISGILPDGVVNSVSSDIVAFTTDEWKLCRDNNGDGYLDQFFDLNDDNYLEQMIQYYDASRDLVVNTGEGGALPVVSNNKIVAVLNPPKLVAMAGMERVTYQGGILSVYDIRSDSWQYLFGHQPMMFRSLALDGNTLVFELDESGSSIVDAMDVNHDGHSNDHLIMMCSLLDPYGTIETVGEGMDPDVVDYDFSLVSYWSDEAQVGVDLNRNGQVDHGVIQFYDYESGQRGVIAEPAEGAPAVGVGYFSGSYSPYVAYQRATYDPVYGNVYYDLMIATPTSSGETVDGICHADSYYSTVNGEFDSIDGGGNMLVFERDYETWKLYLQTECFGQSLVNTHYSGTGPHLDGGFVDVGPMLPLLSGESSTLAQTQPEGILGMDLNLDGDTNDDVITCDITLNRLILMGRETVNPIHRLASISFNYKAQTCNLGVSFRSISSEGIVRAEVRPQSFAIPMPLDGHKVIGPPVELSTTAGSEEAIDVQISYNPSEVVNENNVRLMQFNSETSRWQDITTHVNTEANIVYGTAIKLGWTLSVMEWTGTSSPLTIGLGENPSMDDRILAFELSEAQAAADLNGDGDRTDKLIQYYDMVNGITNNTGLQGIMPSVAEEKIIFQSESSGGGGVVPVIRCVNLTVFDSEELSRDSMIMTIGIGERPSADGHLVAFQTSEEYVGESLNGDADTDDVVILYCDLQTNETVNTGIEGVNPVMAGELIFFLSDDGGASALKCYNTLTSTVTATVANANELSRSASDGKIAFGRLESSVGSDLNGDGDLLDQVICLYDAMSGIATETQAIGWSPSLLDGRIAFLASESERNADLNGDGDKSDWVLQFLDFVSDELINAREEVRSPVTGQVLFSSGNLTAYTTTESSINVDVNGDGDKSDSVVRIVGKKLLFTGLPTTSTKDMVLRYIGQDLRTKDGRFQMTLDAGSLPTDMVVTIDTLPWQSTPLFPRKTDMISVTVVSDAYMVGPIGTPLSSAARVAIEYDETIVNESATRQLLAWSSPNQVDWRMLPTIMVDTDLNLVVFEAQYLSYFAILRDNSKPTSFAKVDGRFAIDGMHVNLSTNVSLTLSDSGSGVAAGFYRVNGGSWIPYSGNFRLNCSGGACVLQHFSVDKAGNNGLITATNLVMDRSSVSGHVFLDRYNGGLRGYRDIEESGLGSWRVTLQGRDSWGTAVSMEEYTDNIMDVGSYRFEGLGAGHYWLNCTLLAGFYATTPVSRSVELDIELEHLVFDFGVVVPAPDPEINFVLKTGWNMWSTPVAVDGLTAKGLLDKIGPSGLLVIRIDKASNSLDTYVFGDDSMYDFPIIVGEGYYVYVNDDVKFSLKGVLHTNPSKTLTDGWNYIGYSSLSSVKASELLASVQDGYGVVVMGFNPNTGNLDTYVVGDDPMYDFMVTPGRAYFIWVYGESTLPY